MAFCAVNTKLSNAEMNIRMTNNGRYADSCCFLRGMKRTDYDFSKGWIAAKEAQNATFDNTGVEIQARPIHKQSLQRMVQLRGGRCSTLD